MKMKVVYLASLLMLVVFTSCQTQSITPNFAEVNDTDALSIGTGEMTGYSGTKTYSYVTTGPNHTLSIGAQITSGNVKVKIKNASGNTLYTNTYSSSMGDVQMLDDSSNPWQIELEFNNAKGSLGFSLSKDE